MLGRQILWLMILVPMLSWGQPVTRFQELLNTAPSQKSESATRSMSLFISKLQAKRTKLSSDEVFLRYMFREAHKTFLSRYKAYSQFPEIFDAGNYDCLSATSFFSIVLEHFGFQYKIMETNYHIFLLVDTGEMQILLESTDQTNGFVSDKKIINERLKRYGENKLLIATSANEYFYQYQQDLYQQVAPQQLAGLLFFNQAISAFNNKEIVESALKLKAATHIYNSPRIAEFAIILVSEIADCDLSDDEKKNLIKPFASIIKRKASVVASR